MGKIADKYRRRAANVGRETARLRGDVASLLVEGLREATQEQLYDRTPLKVSRQMYRSIQPRMLGNNAAGVVYKASIAPHAARRLNLKGRSKSGGHDLTMNPNEVLRRRTDPKIRRAAQAAQRRILNAGD